MTTTPTTREQENAIATMRDGGGPLVITLHNGGPAIHVKVMGTGTAFVIDELGNLNHPIIAAMWDRVEALPDESEGSRFHLASEDAWEIADDYRRACNEDPTVLDEYYNGIDDFAAVKACCLRNAEKVAPD